MNVLKPLASYRGCTGIILLGCLSSPWAAQADDVLVRANSYTQYAKVIQVDPIHRQSYTSTPIQRCSYTQVQRQHTDNHHQRRSIAPSLVGGLIGGVIGNQFGKGHGKTALTIASAFAGARIASRAASRHDHRHNAPSRAPRKHCRTIQQRQEVTRIDGYRVTYRYQGQTFVRTMQEHPGDRVPIQIEVLPLDNRTDGNSNHS